MSEPPTIPAAIAANYRRKAAEARETADETKTPQVQSIYRSIAERYERLAANVEDLTKQRFR